MTCSHKSFIAPSTKAQETWLQVVFKLASIKPYMFILRRNSQFSTCPCDPLDIEGIAEGALAR